MDEQFQILVNNLINAAIQAATYKLWDSRSVSANWELAKARAELVAEIDKKEAELVECRKTNISLIPCADVGKYYEEE